MAFARFSKQIILSTYARAHDYVRAAGLPQAINHDCSLAVLEFRRLISGLAMRRLKVLD